MNKLTIFSFLLFLVSNFSLAQIISEEELMGKWLIKSVDMANDNPKHEEAVSFMKKGYTGAIFRFQGNGIFKVTYPKTADTRIESFDISGENWRINGEKIEVGVGEYFNSMHFVPQIMDGKTYFDLSMMRLEVEKIESEKAKRRRKGKSASGFTVQAQYDSNKPAERYYKDLKGEDVIPFDSPAEGFTPAISPNCEQDTDLETLKKCVSREIVMHVQRKFDIEPAIDLGLSGRFRISVRFIIDTSGQIINIEAEGAHPIMNESAINSIASLPKFTPAQSEGKSVNMEYRMPVVFQIEN
jgi:hypothetical protein